MRPDEDFAALRVEAALGVTTVVHDDNSKPGLYDFRLVGGDRVGALEVVTGTDPRRAEAKVAITRAGNRLFDARTLRHFWGVSVNLPAKGDGSVWPRIRGLEARLEPLLQVFEAYDVVDVRSSDVTAHAHEVRSAISRLAATGVDRVWRPRPDLADRGSGAILLMLDVAGARAGTLDEGIGRLSEFLWATPDVRVKLARSGMPERHCFVSLNLESDWTLHFHMFPRFSDALVLPRAAPSLPPEITHLWLADEFSDTWHWSSSDGWQAFEPPYGRNWSKSPHPDDYVPRRSRL